MKINMALKGSYTVEGTILFPIFIAMLAVTMKLGIDLYNEIKNDSVYEAAVDIWLVDEFYMINQVSDVFNNDGK